MFNGLQNSLQTLSLLSDAKSRSICPESFEGKPGEAGKYTTGNGAGCARDLGQGWKVSPSVTIKPGTTFTMCDIHGSGAIQHIWLTLGTDLWRDMILRFYWDGMDTPAVEVPAGDFFCNGWNVYAPVNSLAVCANPARGFNCYWNMPYRTGCKITMENRSANDAVLYYQIDYTECAVPDDCAYFCASFRTSKPTEGGIHTIIDGIKGKGQYVGTYMTWQVNNNGWWGEGEIKFYMDDDRDFPTICGTGTEDYFCGAYNFDVRDDGYNAASATNPGLIHGQQPIGYTTFSTPYTGLVQVLKPDGLYRANTRFGLYRWHITDPIRFEKELRVTIQDLGWRSGGRYLVQSSYITSVAYWYQTMPLSPLAPLGDRDELEII